MKTNQKLKLSGKFLPYIIIYLALCCLPAYFVYKPLLSLFFPFLLVIVIYSFFYYLTFSFEYTDKHIKVSKGVIFRDIKNIQFDKIQNIEMKAGPLMRIMGVVKLNIWTASQNQLKMNRGNTNNKPDGSIFLDRKDGDFLNTFISEKLEA